MLQYSHIPIIDYRICIGIISGYNWSINSFRSRSLSTYHYHTICTSNKIKVHEIISEYNLLYSLDKCVFTVCIHCYTIYIYSVDQRCQSAYNAYKHKHSHHALKVYKNSLYVSSLKKERVHNNWIIFLSNRYFYKIRRNNIYYNINIISWNKISQNSKDLPYSVLKSICDFESDWQWSPIKCRKFIMNKSEMMRWTKRLARNSNVTLV